MKPEVLIIGCGFLGEVAAELFSAQGKRVLGLVHSGESLRKLAERSFEVARCDVTNPASVEALTSQVHEVPLAVYCVSSGRGGVEKYASIYRDGLARVMAAWNPAKMIFVSSTSVYGQSDGSWVTERSPTLPERETGRILLEAEALALAAGGTVARLSGIYGPSRSELLRKFLSGETVLEDGGGRWINQIHRDDAAAALVRLADPSPLSGIFNVTDDLPVTQKDLTSWLAESLQRPLPSEGSPDLLRKRGWSSKRISNSKLRSLGWQAKFSSYRDALPQFMTNF